jgi:hypothetical protein
MELAERERTCSRHILGYLAQETSLTTTHRDFPGSH